MVFLPMKTPPSCSPHSTVLAHLAKHPWGLRAPSLALLAALILALIGREDVRLTKLAAQLPGKALQRSKVKQLHRFFKNIRLSEDVLARFVLSQGHRKVGRPLAPCQESAVADANNLDFIVRHSPPEFAVNRNMTALSTLRWP